MQMNLKSANSEHILKIQNEFPAYKFDLFTAGESEFVSCIACWIEDSESLKDNWNAIQNIIALLYKTEKKFARWNVYIAFFCKEKINHPLRITIENNKFTARKFVFDSCTEEQFSKEKNFAIKRLNYEIFEVDLEVAKNYGSIIQYKSTPIVSNIKNYSKETIEGKLEIVKKLLLENDTNENKES